MCDDSSAHAPFPAGVQGPNALGGGGGSARVSGRACSQMMRRPPPVTASSANSTSSGAPRMPASRVTTDATSATSAGVSAGFDACAGSSGTSSSVPVPLCVHSKQALMFVHLCSLQLAPHLLNHMSHSRAPAGGAHDRATRAGLPAVAWHRARYQRLTLHKAAPG